jgi:hypothetical protein
MRAGIILCGQSVAEARKCRQLRGKLEQCSSLFPQKVARFRLLHQVGGLDRPVRPRTCNHMYPATQAQR